MITRTKQLTRWSLCRWTFIFALLAIWPMLSAGDAAGAEATKDEAPKRVLILSSYDISLPGPALASQAIRAAFRNNSPARVQFYYESLDIYRIPEDKFAQELVGFLRRKYEGEKIDLIIVFGAPVLKLLVKHRASLLPDTPIVFYYLDETEETAHSLGTTVTGVWSKPEYSKTLETALALQPETARVIVVAGTSTHDKFLLAAAEKELHPYEGRVEITYLTDLTMEELRQKLASLPPRSVVIFLSFYLDSAGKSFSGPEAVSLLAPASSAPIYGISRTYLGYGIVGGSLLDFEVVGGHIGELGVRVLDGERPQDIAPQAVPSVTMFDWRALKRWGISERRLPPGSLIEFREPTFWELNKWYLIIGITVGLIEALLIAGLLVNRVRRRQAEEENRSLAAVAEEQRQKLDDVISNMPGIVWESRFEPDGTTRMEFINDYAEQALGYSVEQWLAAPDFAQSIIHEEDRETLARQRKAILAGGKDRVVQFRWQATDGRMLWAEAHITPILDAAGAVVGMRGVTIDITIRKRAEEALRQSEQHNLDILRALPDMVFLQSSDGTYLDCHTKESSDLLIPPAEFVGKNLRDIMPPELAEAIFACFQRAEETGELQVLEYMMPIQGEPHWFEARIIHTEGNQFLSIVRNITKRKHAEAQLIESEARFRNMADTAPVMIWVSGIDKQCTYFNQRWLDFTGRTLAEEIGPGWTEHIHPDDYERCLETYYSAFERREPFTMEYRLRRVDGQYRWIYDSGIARFSASGEFLGYIGSCTDVSELKLAEEALRDSQAQLAGIISSAMDAIITHDESQRIVLFNTAAEQMFGCSAREVTGQPLDRFLPEQFRQRHRQHIRDFGETNIMKRAMGAKGAIYGRRADGEEFPIEGSISQIQLNGQKFYTIILRDITARQQAEQALKESEANYRQIFNGVNSAIFIHDKETGAILAVNQKMCEMYGVTAEEARSLNANDLSANEPPYTQAVALAWIKKAAAGEPQLFEWRARDKAGRKFWVEVSMKGITLGGKERLLAMMHDITGRKQAEEALQDAFAQVIELKSQLEAENIYLKEEIRLEHNYNEIIGKSEMIRSVFFKIEQVAPTVTTVLILGETGTGKELVARALHSTSLRKNKPLVKVNCATLPTTLIESELFGHERGAFTSATTRQLGRFELANGGSIFLDEIGDLPLELQAKLLRVLQDGEFERLGSGKTIKVNVRIIAATNRNLPLEVQNGQFREDLWYRLNVFPITVPPLRERKEDIPLLVETFVHQFSKRMGKTIGAIGPATMRALQDYSWPGNVRELANVIERAVVNTSGSILRLADQLNKPGPIELPAERQTLEQFERQYIIQILDQTAWRIEGPKGAARILGINSSTLRTRMAKLKIERSKNASD